MIFLCLCFASLTICGQQLRPFRFDTDNYTRVNLIEGRDNKFNVSLYLVFMFTQGVVDRQGLRIGGGLKADYEIDCWRVSAGADMYKALHNFGIGIAFAGLGYDNGSYGLNYYLIKYYQGQRQLSGIFNLSLRDIEIRFEDDILAFPFDGFRVYDRYRTAAGQISYKGFIVGANVYTTSPNGITDVLPKNGKGVYATGKQLSSPMYVGYSNKGYIMRLGWNNRLGGWMGQNIWHRKLFDSSDFQGGNYNNPFLQLGVDQPYTLY